MIAQQPSLFDVNTPRVIDPPKGGSIDERFMAYVEANPHIYRAIVTLARRAVLRGRRRIGIKNLVEVVRWEYSLTIAGDETFKINNDFTSRFARLIMEREHDLRGVFETRELRSRGER